MIFTRLTLVLSLVAVLAFVSGCNQTAGSQDSSSLGSGAGGRATTDPQANRPAPPRKQQPSTARALEKSFDDIKFDIEKGDSYEPTMLNDQVKELVDRKIRIRGYMYPTYKRKGIDKFVLVRDNQECCFGPGAALYDCVRVTLKDGQSVEYSYTPVAVEGVFKVDELFLDDQQTVGTVFHLEGAVVQ